MAMNIVPITVSWQPEHSVDAALAAFREEFRWAVAHPWARHERVSRTFQQRHRVAQQLFGPLVNVIPTALNLTLDGVETSTFNASAGPVEDMTFTVRGNPGQGLSIEVDVNPKLYTQTEASGHAQRITDWLRRITLLSGASLLVELTEPTRQLPHQSPLEAWEHDLVIQSFNATAQPVRARTLADAFAQQVERTPDAEALVYDGRRWTYAQFDAAVTAVAQHVHTALEKAGLDPSVPHAVGVSLTRGPELLAAVHGVHRAGHAYVALDPNDPELRTEAKCADANCRIVLDGRLDDFDALVATGERLMRDESGQTWRTPVMDDPAYVLFTSGSTGRPKGVVVSHRAICNRLEWMQHEFPTGVGDAVVHKTPVTFDVSVWELFWPLQTGATLVIAAPEGHRDPHYLHQLLIGERVKVVHFVPSMLRAFLAHIAEQPHAARPAELRHVICSGEALSSDLVNGARTVLGVDPINLYGPTEAAVDVTYWYTDADRDRHVVPIGYPVWNTQCYVLDARQRPVPIGFPGELYLGGVQLADGYAGQPETTAAAFLTVPGENLGLAQDQRLYRTGDVAAWRWDGSLEYLGRSDDQIKIRGQRIELGEVDAAFLSAPGIADAAVVPHDYGGETQLVAHVVPTNQNVSSTVIAGDDSGATSRWTQALLAHLRRHLTDAMLPIGLVTHQRLPLSSSGKTSRRELSQNQDIMLWASLISGHTGIAEHPMQENAASEAYSDATVLATTQAFTEVLGMHIGPHDDFFLCGGHSLRALQAVNRINRTGLWRVTVADIFAHPTPYTLASHLKESGRTAQTAVNLLRGPSSDEQAGAPVFLLPPAGGLGWCYTPLARALDGERDVYALSMVELLNQEEAPVNLQELAQAFHEQIRSVVGDQPFHIAGWSLGGMAAHTLGALAVESEANVLSVGILDAYPGSCWRDEPIPGRAEAWRAVLRMAGLEPERVLVAFTQHEPELSREDEETLRGELLSEDSLLFGLGAEFIDAALATVRRSAEIIRNSANQAPLLAPIPVLHIQAVQNARFTPDAWTDLTPNGIEFHAVDSTHPGMMRSPHHGQVADVLGKLWHKAEQHHGASTSRRSGSSSGAVVV
jgi:enterobactin synthetase component F